MPNVQQLVEHSFLSSNLKLVEVSAATPFDFHVRLHSLPRAHDCLLECFTAYLHSKAG